MAADFNDWVAICETKARYCRCLDTKDWAGYADVFTEDLHLEVPPDFVVDGRDKAIVMIRGAVENATTAHQVHNPEMIFSADGNSADVIWAMSDRVIWGADRRPHVHDDGHMGYGHYREHYVKCPDGRWRIKRQKLSYLSMDFFGADK